MMGLKGKLTNGLFCSAEVQQKMGCLSRVFEDGKKLDTQMEWGPEGISGGEWRGVGSGESKGWETEQAQ